jgi:hypothetical protein
VRVPYNRPWNIAYNIDKTIAPFGKIIAKKTRMAEPNAPTKIKGSKTGSGIKNDPTPAAIVSKTRKIVLLIIPPHEAVFVVTSE